VWRHVDWFAGTNVCRYHCLQVPMFAGTNVCRYRCLQVPMFAGTNACRYQCFGENCCWCLHTHPAIYSMSQTVILSNMYCVRTMTILFCAGLSRPGNHIYFPSLSLGMTLQSARISTRHSVKFNGQAVLRFSLALFNC
jgi:hypothetical protein